MVTGHEWHIFLYPIGFFAILFIIAIIWNIIDAIQLNRESKLSKKDKWDFNGEEYNEEIKLNHEFSRTIEE